MTGFPLLAISFILNVVAFLFIICCVILILVILIQKGKGGGLSSAFGGGSAGGLLGSKTGDFLTWVTIVLVGVILMFAVVLAKYYKPAPSNIPGVTGAGQTQQQPAAGSEEPESETGTSGQTDNESGSEAVTPGASTVEETTSPAGNTGTTGESINETSDTNQTSN
ncbi:MAG: preprotein translocase subunit SecG [Sedimentisphaerales bacterium]|nr:preprotein translocase subunit SecG [Sedimentisphaerales bacterium]